MTRRRIIFKTTNETLISPEFNGDKTEFEKRGSCLDGCNLTFGEILVKHFIGITSCMQFKIACIEAQKEYHSFLENEDWGYPEAEEYNPDEEYGEDKKIYLDIPFLKKAYAEYCEITKVPLSWYNWNKKRFSYFIEDC